VANTANGFSVDLTATEGNTGLAKLKLEAIHEANSRLRIRITDPANKRFEIPAAIAPINSKVSEDRDYCCGLLLQQPGADHKPRGMCHGQTL
jgi:hypothetical protein